MIKSVSLNCFTMIFWDMVENIMAQLDLGILGTWILGIRSAHSSGESVQLAESAAAQERLRRRWKNPPGALNSLEKSGMYLPSGKLT